RGIHCDDLLAINHGDDFHYIRGTHKRHVGNIHWDEIQMTPENAAKLTNYLMQKPHWNLMVAPAKLWDCVQRCRLSGELIREHLVSEKPMKRSKFDTNEIV